MPTQLQKHTASMGDEAKGWFDDGYEAYQRGDSFGERPNFEENPRRSTFWCQGWVCGEDEEKHRFSISE